jgi:hypothetical protein
MKTLASAALVIAIAVTVTAQGRPDFSGDWVIARANTGLLGEKFTAKQDAGTLTLTITVAALKRDVIAVYNLDGSERQNMNPQGPGIADEPIYSRVTWDGDKLVIATRGTILVNGKPVESKRVIWIDGEGLLNIERSSAGQPTTRSVYRRAVVYYPFDLSGTELHR